MKPFLAKHWLLVVLPLVVIALAVAVILSLQGPEPGTTFDYGM